MAKITYDNKENLNVNSQIPNKNKVSADDMNEIKTSVNELYDTIFDLIYPIGSIYMSVNSTNPSTLFGGTWEAYATGRTIVGVGSFTDGNNETYTFGNSEYSFGLWKHTHQYGFNYTSYYQDIILENNSNAGLLNYQLDGSKSPTGQGSIISQSGPFTINAGNQTSTAQSGGGVNTYQQLANTQYRDNSQPSITTYIWKRTA